MDVNYINGFLNGMQEVFTALGLGEMTKAKVYKKESFASTYDLTTIIGISGDKKGNVSISMEYNTVKKIASTMMMGMEVTEINEMTLSAIGEMSNMICGHAVMKLNDVNKNMDITPPTIIHGSDTKIVYGKRDTITVDLNTNMGKVEFNLSLE